MPVPSTAMPVGVSRSAEAPVPAWMAKLPGEPASVVTTPAGVILRTVPFWESAT